MNIVGQLYAEAPANLSKTAVAEHNKSYSYGDFISDINSTAEYLKQKGITAGDQVLLAVPISYSLYVHFAALLSIGAVIVIIDDWSSVKKVSACLEKVNCKAVIISPKYFLFSYLIKGLRKVPLKIKAKRRESAKKQSVIFNAGDNHPALITFTTGSTGLPKAAVRTHRVLSEQFRLLDEIFSFSSGDILLSNLPIVTLLGFAKRGTAVLPAKINYSLRKGFNSVIKQIQENKVNCLLGSPAFLLNIADKLPVSSALEIKKVGVGGATVSPRQWEILGRKFKSSEITIVYGSTEAEPISVCNNLITGQLISNGVLVGKPVSGVTVKIIPVKDGPFVNMPETLETGRVGEIIVTGPQVVNNYLGGDDVFKNNKITDGTTIWHRTGDAGFMDESGQLYFSGRCKWLFKVNGVLYSPLLYELVFEAFPGAGEGTAVMVDNTVYVFVVSDANPATISGLLADKRLPCNKVRFVKQLPKDKRHHSKINYELLKAIC